MRTGVRSKLVFVPQVLSGFTLLEVLVALTLTAVVLSVGAQMVISGLRSETHAAAIIATMDREGLLTDVLRDDLTNLLVLDEQPCLTLTAGVPPQLELYTRAVVETAEASETRDQPARVVYRLSRTNMDSPGRLVRQIVDLTRPEVPPVEETVVDGVLSWQVDVWHEGKWMRTPVRRSTPKLIRIDVQGAAGDTTNLVIPVQVEGV